MLLGCECNPLFLYHCIDNGTVDFLWDSCLQVSSCWHDDDWTPEGGSHDVKVTSLCEPSPWQGGTSLGFMNYRSRWRQRKQERRLQKCPKPPTCTSAPIHEDHLSHPKPYDPQIISNFLIFIMSNDFVFFTFYFQCMLQISPNFCTFHFYANENFITLSHITRSISLDFYECFYPYAYCCIVDNDLYFLWDPPRWMPSQY